MYTVRELIQALEGMEENAEAVVELRADEGDGIYDDSIEEVSAVGDHVVISGVRRRRWL